MTDISNFQMSELPSPRKDNSKMTPLEKKFRDDIVQIFMEVTDLTNIKITRVTCGMLEIKQSGSDIVLSWEAAQALREKIEKISQG